MGRYPTGEMPTTDSILFPRRDCSGRHSNKAVGCSTFMYNGPELEPIRRKFGRGNAWGKIFFNPLQGALADYIWQGTHGLQDASSGPLLEATAIQNIAALHGLAPRVYGIFLAERQQRGTVHPAQLCDYVDPTSCTKQKTIRIFDALAGLGARLGYTTFPDLGSNCKGDGQWVDFQGWRFMESYEERLALRVQELGRFQGPLGSYQSISELGWDGRRDSASRVKQLGLDQLDFTGRTVLDVGCSVGAFCRYAFAQGASRVVGIDRPKPIKAAAEVSAYLGYGNIDYLALDLRSTGVADITEQTGIEQFDIVLFLAMNKHIGFPDWLSPMCRHTLVFETHPHPHKQLQAIRAELSQGFEAVVHIGKSGDQYPREVFWAFKENGGT